MKTVAERFAEKVRVPADAEACWEWTAATNGKRGYGSFHVDGKLQSAHRVALALAGELLIDGLVVDHLCCNKLCVNPLHLRQVTFRENVFAEHSASITKLRKMRTHCPAGHEYSEANTRMERNRGRRCKTCHRLRVRARNSRMSSTRSTSPGDEQSG